MAIAKNIQLFLMDGTTDGRVKCSIAGWTGVTYKIPRNDLEQCKSIPYLKQSGIYFLFGVDDESQVPVVYVGQAGIRMYGEGILTRLQEHKRNPHKDYWTEAVAFTTSDNSFGPTELCYLENKFCEMARLADRYTVKNEITPSPGNVTEEKESELEDFIEHAELVMGTLGHKVFIPLAVLTPPTAGPNPIQPHDGLTLYINHKLEDPSILIKATCQQTNEGFVVLKGSTISPVSKATISTRIAKIRDMASRDANNILQEDVLLKSPSGAAMFVLGQSASGWSEWKTASGKTLRDLEVEEV